MKIGNNFNSVSFGKIICSPDDKERLSTILKGDTPEETDENCCSLQQALNQIDKMTGNDEWKVKFNKEPNIDGCYADGYYVVIYPNRKDGHDGYETFYELVKNTHSKEKTTGKLKALAQKFQKHYLSWQAREPERKLRYEEEARKEALEKEIDDKVSNSVIAIFKRFI